MTARIYRHFAATVVCCALIAPAAAQISITPPGQPPKFEPVPKTTPKKPNPSRPRAKTEPKNLARPPANASAKTAPVAPDNDAKQPVTDAAQPDDPNVDLAFGAYQRGYYQTAFKIATERAEQKNDPKSMALLGELYSGALGMPRDDVKAAQWYKRAADLGDRAAMFAYGMTLIEGRPPRSIATKVQNGWPPRPSLAMPQPPIILDYFTSRARSSRKT